MLATAVVFWQVILALHIVAVVIAFGVGFAYPLMAVAGSRLDARSMPAFHRVQQIVGRRVVNPGLTVVLLAGIYLAAKLHQWHAFYVQWGIGAVLVIGGLVGAVIIRSEGTLAELAERDIAAAGTEPVKWSPEYQALAQRVQRAGALVSALVVITIYLMSVQAGA